MEPFETERLLVRQFQEKDGDDCFAFNGNEQVVKFIRPAKTREESDAFLLENLDLYLEGFPYGRMHVSEKETGNFVGTFSLLYLDGEADYHIGYGLIPSAWGKGFGAELVQYGTAIFFARTTHATLFAITDPDNIASEKLLYNYGYQLDGTYDSHGKSLNLFKMNRADFLEK
jgi:ribosomal-protein-alanine N-acetyltransferase